MENETFTNPADDMILPDDFHPEAESYDLENEGQAEGKEPITLDTPENALSEQAEKAEDGGRTTVANSTETESKTGDESLKKTPQTIRVRYNHEDRELSTDEAAILAQKGLNYDKLEARARTVGAFRDRAVNLASELGYASPEEMFDAAEKNLIDNRVNELIEAGNTEAVAKFLVEQDRQKAAAKAAAKSPKAAEPYGLTPERKAELDEFVRAHPGITDLPDEVVAENRRGVRLIVAYERYQNKAAQRELAILRQNQAAAARAPVSGVTGKASTGVKGAPDDPFLKGLSSDDY